MKYLDHLQTAWANSEIAYWREMKVAHTLPYCWHWLLGFLLVLPGLALENLPSLIAQPAAAVCFAALGAFPISWLSRFIMMPLCPKPYAWWAARGT